MSAARLATEAELAHVARQVEALRRLQLLSTLRDEALAELRRLDLGPMLDSGPIMRPTTPTSDPCRYVCRARAAQDLAVSKRTITRWAAASGCYRRSPTGALLVDLPAMRAWRNGSIG